MAREVSVTGLDTAKSAFRIHGAERQGRAVLHQRLRRGQMQGYFAQLKPCVVGIEATQGAHYWARVLTAHGHSVPLIPPHFLKPFLKSPKKDANDVGAICEAVSRPSIPFVPAKSIKQQDLQALHRVRSRMIACHTLPVQRLVRDNRLQPPAFLAQTAQLPQLLYADPSILLPPHPKEGPTDARFPADIGRLFPALILPERRDDLFSRASFVGMLIPPTVSLRGPPNCHINFTFSSYRFWVLGHTTLSRWTAKA